MSQAGELNSASGPVPPTVPTSFVTDSGTAIPAANVLNVVTPGGGTQGITTLGSGNTITVELTDFTVGTATTVGATTAILNVNVPIPNNSSASIIVNIVGHAIGGGSVGGESIGLVENAGGVLSIIQISDVTRNNTPTLPSWNVTLTTSGANAQVQVLGVAGLTINWRGLIDAVIAP